MPLTRLQIHVLRLLAAERSPDSYKAGGVAINRDGPRFSGNIDAEADEKTLTTAGLKLSWRTIVTGKREAAA